MTGIRIGRSSTGINRKAIERLLLGAALLCGLAAVAAPGSTHLPVVSPILPDNPMAFAGCTAQVNVEAARLRRAPSVVGQILGLRFAKDKVKVTRILEGKWAAVETESGEAYLAAYLLDFPRQEFLDQWKKEGPTTSPALGKRARVKWAALPFRLYPDTASPAAGMLRRGAIVSRVLDLGDGWALVRAQVAEDVEGAEGVNGAERDCLGFLPAGALEVFREGWAATLPLTPLVVGESETAALESEPIGVYAWRTVWAPELFGAGEPMESVAANGGVSPNQAPQENQQESPSEYLARTAWSPEVFRAERRAETFAGIRAALSGQLPEPNDILADGAFARGMARIASVTP